VVIATNSLRKSSTGSSTNVLTLERSLISAWCVAVHLRRSQMWRSTCPRTKYGLAPLFIHYHQR